MHPPNRPRLRIHARLLLAHLRTDPVIGVREAASSGLAAAASGNANRALRTACADRGLSPGSSAARSVGAPAVSTHVTSGRCAATVSARCAPADSP